MWTALIVLAVLGVGAYKFRRPLKKILRWGEGQANQGAQELYDSAPVANQQLNLEEAADEMDEKRELQKKIRGNLGTQRRKVNDMADDKPRLERELQTRINKALELAKTPEGEEDEAKEARLERLRRTKASGVKKKRELTKHIADLAEEKKALREMQADYDAVVKRMEQLEDVLDQAEEDHEGDVAKLDTSRLKSSVAQGLAEMNDGRGDSAFAKIKTGREAILREIDDEIGSAEVENDRMAEDNFERELDEMTEVEEAEDEFEQLLAEAEQTG